MIEFVEESYTKDKWRMSIYRRQDGSTFKVALPSMLIKEGIRKGCRLYDEAAEARMLLRLANLPNELRISVSRSRHTNSWLN